MTTLDQEKTTQTAKTAAIELRPMTDVEQRLAAKDFARNWLKRDGFEIREGQMFWMILLYSVFGVVNVSDCIQFEQQVPYIDSDGKNHPLRLDGVIPATRVLIKQTSADCPLHKKSKQSDGSELSPIEQARRYDLARPVSEHARYIVLCNFREFEIYDCEQPNSDPVVIKLEDLEEEYYRLRFLIAEDHSLAIDRQAISIQAGVVVSKIYDTLLSNYHGTITPEVLQDLNKLCVRFVLCLYAEDAGLLNSRTQLHDFLLGLPPKVVRYVLPHLFKALTTQSDERDANDLEEIRAFPYVDGALFESELHHLPVFTEEVIDLLVNQASAHFKWRDISPTIFGAIFESTLNPQTRRLGGMHYTSIENIHKVIDPLFLDDLWAEFHQISTIKSENSRTRQLDRFQDKLASLKFLDPACGSGNFLTEIYISLRRLENELIRVRDGGRASLGREVFDPIKVSINQLYGIEINDFAVSVARTALWIAENQMLQETCNILGFDLEGLPLKSYPNICEANALTTSWSQVVPYEELDYIIGNPPFSGYSVMSPQQKSDMCAVFGDNSRNAKGVGMLDYVCAWFKKAADIMAEHPHIQTAFVATNSICQGTSVANLWRGLLQQGIEIEFAYRSFRWNNEAMDKAAVYCVIIGMQAQSTTASASGNKAAKAKLLFAENGEKSQVAHINAYLIAGDDIFIEHRNQPLCGVPTGAIGSKLTDGGNFLFSPEEKEDFLSKEPQAAPYFRQWFGAEEFLHGTERYCLYLGECTEQQLLRLPQCRKVLAAVKEYRLNSRKAATRKLAEKPWRFESTNIPQGNVLVIPKDSSGRRRYIPMGFMSAQECLFGDKLRLFPRVTLYHFSVLTSSVHMVWVNAVGGRLKQDFSYTNTLVYNNFPWPEQGSAQLKQRLSASASKILKIRKEFADFTLAQLYEPEAMPQSLLNAHQENDALVMQAYGFAPDLSEDQILSQLFALYQKLSTTQEENNL